ncbi:glycoside hydrolase family 5 protein [Schizophyllum commune]
MAKFTLTSLALALSVARCASAAPSAAGFVSTNGTKFTLDGEPYTVVGFNSYWVGLNGYSTDAMDQAFKDIAGAGATTVRTWGFNEVTSPNGIPYYQSWSGSTPTVNTGADGLENFDNVVAAAKANGLKLIVALTNNWADYGGMDVYTKQILGSSNDHDAFYTNDDIKTAFKSYINAFVSRYADEPTILAWELANEPRCKGSPGTSSGSCTTETVTAWINEISAYIKSLDSNHLVAVGDEGFFNQPGNPSYPYQGGEGVDFDANLAIDSIDFGTFHAYPESWGQSDAEAWGTQWIADHATSQETVGKPVIIEEFGVTSNQAEVYTAWLNEVVSSGLAGDLIWQAGSHLPNGDTADDGFAIFPDDPVYPLLQSHAEELKSRDGSA